MSLLQDILPVIDRVVTACTLSRQSWGKERIAYVALQLLCGSDSLKAQVGKPADRRQVTADLETLKLWDCGNNRAPAHYAVLAAVLIDLEPRVLVPGRPKPLAAFKRLRTAGEKVLEAASDPKPTRPSHAVGGLGAHVPTPMPAAVDPKPEQDEPDPLRTWTAEVPTKPEKPKGFGPKHARMLGYEKLLRSYEDKMRWYEAEQARARELGVAGEKAKSTDGTPAKKAKSTDGTPAKMAKSTDKTPAKKAKTAYVKVKVLSRDTTGGDVWLADNRSAREGEPGQVVLKELHDSQDDEAGFLRRLEHPSIVALLDVIHTSSLTTLVLPFFPCGTLADRIKAGPLDKTLQSTFESQLVAGVKYCHRQSVMHRDLKPQNLLVDTSAATPTLKIADFGSSRVLARGRKTSGMVTIWYRAPEILLDRQYGAAIDLWSVGCILVEMETRRPLFYVSAATEEEEETLMIERMVQMMGWPEGRLAGPVAAKLGRSLRSRRKNFCAGNQTAAGLLRWDGRTW